MDAVSTDILTDQKTDLRTDFLPTAVSKYCRIQRTLENSEKREIEKNTGQRPVIFIT